MSASYTMSPEEMFSRTSHVEADKGQYCYSCKRSTLLKLKSPTMSIKRHEGSND